MHIQTIGEGLRRWRRPTFGLLGLFVLWLVASSGRFLVVDKPQKADVILVLAGETDRRPVRGLELLDQGYGTRLVLDVPAVYRWSLPELAEKYAQSLPKANAITVCPFTACQRARRRRKPAVAWRRLAEEMCCW